MTRWETGVQLGPYHLLEHIGAGGMGEVWKARDARLDRIVAIKRLKAEHTDRFKREARAIASLNHPHICQIYDVGSDYLVMEYVEGEPLKSPLPSDETVRLAIQIADALEAAHRKGIVHRDLKPGNILVSAGTVKLLDFGLAKIQDPRPHSDAFSTLTVGLTEPGVVVGTVAYMSPEQAQGQAVDARSDIFSFGLVLYQVLSGKRAFAGETAFATMSAIVRDEPPPLAAPPTLERIVTRCLRKSPSERFQTMTEIRKALEQISLKAADDLPSIAVLPFANMSRDPDEEYFSDGLAEEIMNLLAHLPGLKVTARTSAFAFRGKEQDITKIAEALRVRTILEGSVRRAGSRIRVTAQLINAEDGYHLWSERYDRELIDIFAIQDEIAQSISSALQVKLAGTFTQHKPKLAAYEALLRGRHHRQKFTPDGHARSMESFEQAIALDPNYAAPHAELAFSYLFLASGVRTPIEVADLVRAKARRALELDPSETNPHFLLGAVAATYDYDWQAAAEHFGKAMSGSCVSTDARFAYAALYLQPQGQLREAVEQMRLVVEQDPMSIAFRAVLGFQLTTTGMYDRGLEEMRKALELDEDHWVPNVIIGEAYLVTGKLAEAVAAAEKAFRAYPLYAMTWGLLAAALVRVGQKDRAAALIREGGDSPKPIWGRVLYHLLCLEIDEAADWYESMIQQREQAALIYVNSPAVKPLRGSPRWLKLARMMNLPEPAS